VPPDAAPDNPEFLAPEMEVADWQTHIRDVDRARTAADVPLISQAARAKISCMHAGDLARFNYLSENGLLNQVSVVEKNEYEIIRQLPFQDKFVPPFRRCALCRAAEMLRAEGEDNFVHALAAHCQPLFSILMSERQP
jgi:hypothetical protein